MPDDNWILNEFRRSIRRSAESKVIELDNVFNYKFDFQIQGLEDVVKVVGTTIPPNRWSYYRIGLLTQGSIDFITGMHRFTAKKNTLVVFPSRIITSSRNWQPDTAGYLILFNLEFFLQNSFPHKYIENKRVLNGSLRPYIDVTPEETAQLSEIFEKMLSEKNSDHKTKNELIALKTIELLIKTERLFEEKQQIEDNLPSLEIIQRFSDLVETNFAAERSVAFYASQLNLHPNYLNAVIKKNTGLTAKESIQNRLLLESKYLLHSTDLSIKEISNLMGFTDPNYFTVFFKKSENTSPTSYRGSFV